MRLGHAVEDDDDGAAEVKKEEEFFDIKASQLSKLKKSITGVAANHWPIHGIKVREKSVKGSDEDSQSSDGEKSKEDEPLAKLIEKLQATETDMANQAIVHR